MTKTTTKSKEYVLLKLKLLLLAIAFAMSFSLPKTWMIALQATVTISALIVNAIKFWRLP